MKAPPPACFRFRVFSLLASGLAALSFLLAGPAAPAQTALLAATTFTAATGLPPVTSGNDTDVVAAYQAWVNALAKAHGNPESMLKFYAPEAVLVATYSPNLLHNARGELATYFKKFTALPNLQCTTQELDTRLYGDWAINTGLFTFTHDTFDGEQVVIPARFTFVYRKVGDQWLIVDQHTSLVPPGL
jgi:hypothetical protein